MTVDSFVAEVVATQEAAIEIATSRGMIFGQLAALDEAHRLINAEGGTFDPADKEAAARAAMIDRCLEIIESLGGMDPATRRARARDAKENAA